MTGVRPTSGSPQRRVAAAAVRHRSHIIGQQRRHPRGILVHHARDQLREGRSLALAHARRRDDLDVEAVERAARAVMQHAHVAFAGIEDRRHLGRRVVEHVDQQQHRPGSRRQGFERNQERVADLFGLLHAPCGIRRARRCRVGGVELLPCLQRRRQPGPGVGAPFATPQAVQAQIGRDTNQPPLEIGASKLPFRLHRTDEGLLDQLVGVGGDTGHLIAESPEPALGGAKRSLDGRRSVHGRCCNASTGENVTRSRSASCRRQAAHGSRRAPIDDDARNVRACSARCLGERSGEARSAR